MKSQENLKYPIGKFQHGKTYSLDDTRKHIKAIARLPKELKKLLKKLKGNRIDLPYRRGGWTARQVVHHIVDSHINAYIRMKMAVTEQAPIIKPYEESLWAETEDGKNAPVKLSLRILTPLHKRWVMFLESLSEEELDRSYYHPGMQRLIPLPEAIALYAWHSLHHTAHIRLIVEGKSHDKKVEKKTKTRKHRVQKAKNAAASSSTKTAAAPPKRKRRSSAEVAAEKAAKAAAPKLSRAEILARARAARTANIAQKPSVAPKKASATPKRKRRSSAEVAAEKAAKAAAPKLSRAEILARARAARTANIAQKPSVAPKKASATPKRKRRSSAEVAAEKAAKAAMPKLSRADILAKARAARAANIAQKPPSKPKKAAVATTRKRRSSAEVAAEKAAKAAAPKLSRAEILARARAARTANIAQKPPSKPKAKSSSGTKRKGLSAERMAEIRAMRGKKK